MNEFKLKRSILISLIILIFIFIVYFVSIELKDRSLVNNQYKGKIKSANLSISFIT